MSFVITATYGALSLWDQTIGSKQFLQDLEGRLQSNVPAEVPIEGTLDFGSFSVSNICVVDPANRLATLVNGSEWDRYKQIKATGLHEQRIKGIHDLLDLYSERIIADVTLDGQSDGRKVVYRHYDAHALPSGISSGHDAAQETAYNGVLDLLHFGRNQLNIV